MKAALFIIFVIALANAKVPWPVEQCGTSSDLVFFTQAYLNAKPSKGSTNEITLIGEAGEHVEFTEVTLTAKLFGVPVQVYHNPYTEVYDGGDAVTYIYNNEIPSFTPSGNYLITFEFVDRARGGVGCAGIKFSL